MKYKFVKYTLVATVHEIDAQCEELAYMKYETYPSSSPVETYTVDSPSHIDETEVSFWIPDKVRNCRFTYPYSP